MINSYTKQFIFILAFFLLTTALTLAQGYKVAEGDVIRIEVYDNADLNTIVRVSEKGTIVIPLLGKVNIKNHSTNQISEKISRLLADGYLVNPQVNVFINDYRGQQVQILGQVRNPGTFELQGSTTFLELISKAGGLTENASDQAIIKRTNGQHNKKQPTIITIDLKTLMEKGETAQNINIIDGDNISIGKVGQYYVTGEVRNPSSFRYDKGDFPNVIKAITLAKGFTENANQDGIIIYRKDKDKKITLKTVKFDTNIQANDVILVPGIFTENFKGQKANILGQVKNPGYFELRGPTTLLEFISKAGGLTDAAGDTVTIKRIDKNALTSDPKVISVDLDALIEKGDMSQNIEIIQSDSVYINRVGQYYVSGQINNPNAYEYRKGDFITVIKAITLAGGFSANADQDDIIIYRKNKDKKITLKSVKFDTSIQANDVIMVPSVFLEDFKGQKANILGQINKPGYFELRGPTTLLEFISRAGGLTEVAGDTVTIKRIDPDTESLKTRVITVDLDALIEKGDLSQNINIIQGDSVYINRMGQYYVNGQVSRPDAYEFRKGDAITVVKAITLAGGFTGSADEDGIKIVRIINGKESVLNDVKMSRPILENDIIVVPESFF